jgi:general secretion pathway protein M
MIERARYWWSGRSTREQGLLGVMVVLFGLLLFWALIIRPIDAARLAAIQRLDAATLASGRVSAAAESIRDARRTAPPTLSATLPVAVGQAAETAGFTMARLDAQGADRVTIAISTARSPALFAWFAVLSKQGVVVDRVTLRTNSDATLAVEGVLRVQGR